MRALTLGEFLILLFFLISGKPSFSQEILSLDSLLRQVENTHPGILKYSENIKAKESKSEGSRSWMAPTLSAGFNRFPYDIAMIKDKMDPMNQAGLMFSLEQMIPNPSKLNARENYNKSLKEVDEKNLEWSKNFYKTEAKLLYFNRAISEKRIGKLKESEELLTLFLNTAENKYIYNQSELANIYTIKARIQEIINMQLMAHASIAEANIGINSLLNRPVGYIFLIDTSIVSHTHNIIEGQANTNRADIGGMEKGIQTMELNKELMAAGNKPDFGIRIEHMQMFGMPNQFSVMGMITIPFVPWSSKMYKSEVKSMQYEIESMKREKESMELMASRMISEKHSMLKYELLQLKNYEENIIPAFKKSFEINFISYRQNKGSFISLMDSWDMLLMKELERLEKLGNVLKLRAEYEYEMGLN